MSAGISKTLNFDRGDLLQNRASGIKASVDVLFSNAYSLTKKHKQANKSTTSQLPQINLECFGAGCLGTSGSYTVGNPGLCTPF